MNATIFAIRPMDPVQEAAVEDFVLAVFAEALASGIDAEGQRAFQRLVQTRRGGWAGKDAFTLVATADEALAGVVHCHAPGHVSLLFVGAAHREQGLGRRLLQETESEIRQRWPASRRMLVNAADGAMAIYLAMGFLPAGERTRKDGLVFTPMARPLEH